MSWWEQLIKAIREWLRRFLEWEHATRKERQLDEDEVPRDDLDLKDDPEIISPPIVDEPLYRCAIAVTVRGFVPHAEIEIQVAGTTVMTQVASFPEPDGESFALPSELHTGEEVRARQEVDGVQSDWSNVVTVRDHTLDYPAGPPRPQINPAPVYKCGSRTGVGNLLIGCEVWITADGSEVGRGRGAKEQQGVNVNPDYGPSQQVRAWSQMCDDPSPPSQEYITQTPPSPLPTPDMLDAYEGSEQITITDLVNGARFTLHRGATLLGTWRTWGWRHLVGLSPALGEGETIRRSQRMCPSDPSSPDGSSTVLPCSDLPAPVVAPIQAGDRSITLLEFVSDARIKVFVNGVKAGDGGGAVVQLTEPVRLGDTVYVVQGVGACQGSTARRVEVQCVAPPVTYDPSALDLFPVGHTEYDGGTFPFLGEDLAIKGTVYYPTRDDGHNQPFHERLAHLGRVPIVFIAHGNHGKYRHPTEPVDASGNEQQACYPQPGWMEIPNHEGYDYFQRTLARMGIIAVSVYSNQGNCRDFTPTTIRRRAEIILASIKCLQSMDAGGDAIFGDRIDFSRVGLMGHSQGAEAVVVVPEIIALPGVTIRSVLSLAPVDFAASSGRPRGYAFMTILPAGDGDVIQNDGARFYDQAEPEPFKCQLYVHHANHNYFNRQWLEDDGLGPPVMSRYDHERLLLTYGTALFRATLLGHNTQGFLIGNERPAGVRSENVHLSAELKDQTTVDHHEDGNTIAINSMGQPTQQSAGLTADEYPFAGDIDYSTLVRVGAPGAFNHTFYGNTTGMVVTYQDRNGVFRSELDEETDLSDQEVWIRVADVYNGTSVPASATGFSLGLEDGGGTVAWIDSDAVGGLPRPYDRRADDLDKFDTLDLTKTMLKTLCFRVGCARPEEKGAEWHSEKVRAILLRCNRADPRNLAFDNLQIVST